MLLPLSGTGMDFYAGGPYLTQVKLGNPPRALRVLIDTGSNPSWVNCQAGPNMQPGLFDPISSSTSSVFNCYERRCQQIMRNDSGWCDTSNDYCEFGMNYGVGSEVLSTTHGYYLSDVFHLDIINGSTSSSAIPIIFGCTNSRTGQMKAARFDGILGFGPSQISFSSQIFSLGRSPKMFTFCMKRSDGGGSLVFGKILEPGLVYTPLLPSRKYYEVNLKSINVSGRQLQLDPSVFRPSAGYKTYADSGTTLVFLADDAYAPFVSAITAAVPPFEHPTVQSGGLTCFVTSGSIDSFPNVTLNFAGDATMKLGPKNYLRSAGQSIYCLAWLSSKQQVTILGDIVFADKLIVHDMENMLLGWKDYDCSLPINATASWEKKQVNSAHALRGIWIPTGVSIIITFIVTFRRG